MGKVIDITNQIFGELEVVKFDQIKNHKAYWWCRCSCGNPELVSILGKSLRSGNTRSCGHCNEFNIIGKKFFHLTVLRVNPTYKEENNINANSLYYDCICDCEDAPIVTVNGWRLRNNKVKSCGHYRRKRMSELRLNDLTNQQFNFIKVLYPTDKRNGTSVVWHCLCEACGNECDISAKHIKEIISCGCLHSQGENNIRKILINNNIQFETEYSFQSLINTQTQNKYRYDFYLPKYNRLIEFDGEQHYNPVDYFGGQEKFEKTQQSDKIKNEYALAHNIPLVRIPYWERDNITLEMLLGNKYLITEAEEEEQIIF